MSQLEKEILINEANIKEISKRLEVCKSNNNSRCQNHNICYYLANSKVKNSIGVFLTTNYNNHKVLVLGKEREGNYKDKYNFCAGSGEMKDINSSGNFCWITCLLRELFEEFKINITSVNAFNRIFYRYVFIHNNTPMFIGHISNLNKDVINKKIKEYNSSNKVNSCYKEMDNIDFFSLNNYKQIDGKECDISSFVDQVVKKLKI